RWRSYSSRPYRGDVWPPNAASTETPCNRSARCGRLEGSELDARAWKVGDVERRTRLHPLVPSGDRRQIIPKVVEPKIVHAHDAGREHDIGDAVERSE